MESIEIEAISQSPQTPKLRQHLKFVGFICTIYALILLGALCVLLLIPSAPASSNIYYQLYFTNQFEPFKIFYFFLLIITGKIYLRSVTLKNYLRVTRTSKETTLDTYLYLFLSLLVFLFGSNATLKATSSENSYTACIIYNYLCFTIPYIAFLHITYLISGVLVRVSISYDEIWKWSYRSWIPLSGIIIICIGLIGYQFYLLYTYSRLLIYGIIYSIVFFLVNLFLYYLKGRYAINDYFWVALIVIPLTATPSIGSAILQGILLGIFTEGTIRVGYSNIFISLLE